MLNFDKPNNNKIIFGYNTGHHGGGAIITGGSLASISEERLSRQKYSSGYLYSLFYLINRMNLKIQDIDLFVSSSYHNPLEDDYQGILASLGVAREKFVSVDHHLSHAYSTYFLSPFNKALVVVVDGLGNLNDTESYYLAEGEDIKKIGGNDPNRSIHKGIGRAYESFTNFCGWSAQEAGKTMGLASYGQEKNLGVDLYEINNKNQISSKLEGKYSQGALKITRDNNLDFGVPFSEFNNKDAAFFVQDRTEKIIIELINNLYEQYKITDLCLAGGVFLNSIINKKILDQTPIKNIFVPPCCDDTGQPLGNALYGYHGYFGIPKNIQLNHAYLGMDYEEKEIIDVLEKKQEIYSLPYEVKSFNFKYKYHKDIASITAELLANGKIIGWFQGGSEIGPRALGHRSILTAPYPAEMKDILNEKVKHREGFRPFAPSVLEEYAQDFFELEVPSPFMLLVAKAKEDKVDKIPAALHVDKTARVQTVNKKDNGIYYDLIKEFYKITDVPVLLNTSFNDSGEPVVETPKDALRMFCTTPIDYLVLGNYLVSKSSSDE